MNWRKQFFDKNTCNGIILKDTHGNINVSGRVKSNIEDPVILYWAGNPADKLTSYSGSGLPFSNPEQAYENSINQGATKASNREFSFNIQMPNSYYVGLGSLYIPPHLHIKVCEPGVDSSFHTIKLSEGVPYRTLTYTAPPSKSSRINPLFYSNRYGCGKLPHRSQEQILRDSSYPTNNKMSDDFWGLKPAQ